ncbi:Maf family protein [Thermoproteota archaeon]
MSSEFKIVLASTSPRRMELMRQIFDDFIIVEPKFQETLNHIDPSKRAIINAEAKTLSVACAFPDSVIIGADTIVYLDGLFLGKPNNPDTARDMLGKLSGKMHLVYTGVAVFDSSTGILVSGFEETKVFFKNLSSVQIEKYVDSGKPLDKAGAYGIQDEGGLFIDRIIGTYSNVMGLPLDLLRDLLRSFII